MRLIILIAFLGIDFQFIAAKSKKASKRNEFEYKTDDARRVIYQEYGESPSHQIHQSQSSSSSSVSTEYDHHLVPPPPPPSSSSTLDDTEHIPLDANDGHGNYNQDSHYLQPNEYSYSSANDNKEKTYNLASGYGLRSIAQGSANQAHSAVENQHTAAKQAAYLAKNSLAQTALQAAATAQAALTGKEVLLHELEQQIVDARNSFEAEIAQLQLAKKASKSAQQAAVQALNHVSSLTATLNSAQSVATQAEHTAQKATSELASQTSMVEKAKSRLESLEDQLKAVHIDFIATKQAAIKAANSAQQAQYNADEAAAHVTIELANSKNTVNDESDHVDHDVSSKEIETASIPFKH